ncbi:MAG TPA: carboxypeptidase-like regulatory domain-containing protein [Bryobacteraceae bacterium]|nr:carboxypeptidase-like regulatory domain-containing protein [Bryobacteraceae bacterium]
MPAWPQATSTSTITGQVMDQQGAMVPAAQVSLTDKSTGSTLTTSSNETGRYVFINVPSGVYTLTFTKTGFNAFKVSDQQVQVGQTLNINATLEVGVTSSTVEVKATNIAELQTASAAVGTSISGAALIALPNLGRDVSTLAVLQPGVTLGGYTAGAYEDQNTFMLDGGNASDDMSGEANRYGTNFTGLGGTQQGAVPSGVVPTPVESIEEFRVSTFSQTADFNNSLGSEVQMVTKRGSNEWHGSGYWYYYATNVGAANLWSNNHTPLTNSAGQVLAPSTPLPSNHRNRFGGTLGGKLLPRLLGGKTFFFVNYEGLRYPNVGNYERPVPTDTMRAGVIFVPNSSGTYLPYNLNPYPVTAKDPVTNQMTTYQPATCPAGLCDPRGLGVNPIIQKIWSYMPAPNDPYYAVNGGDGYNVMGYLSTIRQPLKENSYVARIDHDFGDKNRFFATYRYMRLTNLTNNQADIGGLLPGDTQGVPAAVAPRPQNPGYLVLGLTTNVAPTITNEFRFNYTRNFWQWGSANAPPQLPGLGGAVEIASGYSNSTAESSTCANTLIPYNVGTQCTRQRFWDGQDKLVRDDLTKLFGNHLFQFGGSYQRNYDYHMRTDNGSGINDQIIYQIASTNINLTNTNWIPTTVGSSYLSNWRNLYSEALGLVSQPQVAYTRSGTNLTVNPVGQPAFDQSVIPYYSVYFSDTWRMKPTFTLTYSLGWALEMPPYEINGKQVTVVTSDGSQVDTADYLALRQKAALAGQVYEPVLGFATVRNVGDGLKYPYQPFYGGFSPRLSAAWNPKFSGGVLGKLFGSGKTVLRGGYGRIYGRLNGVNLVLVPLLGIGPLQPVTCAGPKMDGTCAGANNVDASNVFRIGTDGLVAPLPAPSQTLAQPFLMGYNGAISAGDVNTLDPHYKPQRTDNVSISVQRQFHGNMMLDVGYIGRIIRGEMQELNLDDVPYMTTLGGQSFAQAYATVAQAMYFAGASPGSLAAQPFFETALGGANSAYCQGYGNCTQAVASKLTSTFKSGGVSDIWNALNKAPSWILGRTMISGAGGGVSPLQATSLALTTSMGFGNYNALYVSYKATDFHGMTAISNFTWGRALGTAPLAQANSSNTALDAWNMHANYGPNGFDVKFLYNVAIYYAPPVYKGQHGVLGHLLGGWTVAPIFTAQSGASTCATYTEGSLTASEAFGESSSGSMSSTADCATFASRLTGTSSAYYNNNGSTVSNPSAPQLSGVAVGTNNSTHINMFSDPAAVYNELRPCILGLDTNCGGYGNLRGLPTWNLDASLTKDVGIWKEGRVGATLNFQFTNILNHMQPSNGSLNWSSPATFGRITGQSNTPRQMEFGLRIHF